jgi:YidC/Oxa1 family membrane protein insertase
MDFGIGFLSNNVMLRFIDFFYGVVPSYGLAIVALTLAARFVLWPLSAGQIRNMRKMKVSQPVMQKRMKELQERYKNDPAKQQTEISALYKEFGNPLAGCLPLVVQMPVLFALFATLRGSPFSDVPYNISLNILPQEQMALVQPQAFKVNAQNIYLADGVHQKIEAILPAGNKVGVGDKVVVDFQTLEGTPFTKLAAQYPESDLKPTYKVMTGGDRVSIAPDGTITALQPGDATVQAFIPGLASNKGFLFIKALGHVGARDADGTIHWDTVAMVLFFGASLFVSQQLTGKSPVNGEQTEQQQQQETINKFTPVIFSGMFLFFPLPAGVLMYMVIGNIFQTVQTFVLSREPLPENLQKIVDAENSGKTAATATVDVSAIAFEPGSKKKKKS